MPNPEEMNVPKQEAPKGETEKKAEAKEKAPDALVTARDAGQAKVAELRTSAKSLEEMISKADPEMKQMFEEDLRGVQEQIDAEEKKLAETSAEAAALAEAGADKASGDKVVGPEDKAAVSPEKQAIDEANVVMKRMAALEKRIDTADEKKPLSAEEIDELASMNKDVINKVAAAMKGMSGDMVRRTFNQMIQALDDHLRPTLARVEAKKFGRFSNDNPDRAKLRIKNEIGAEEMNNILQMVESVGRTVEEQGGRYSEATSVQVLENLLPERGTISEMSPEAVAMLEKKIDSMEKDKKYQTKAGADLRRALPGIRRMIGFGKDGAARRRKTAEGGQK